MKIQLTIKTTYLPTWGAYEGIRELVQNARDAEFEHQAPLKLDHQGTTLRIENEGVTLPLKALLLGHTTKLGRSDTIGKFGEGLKLGILALVRAGHPVKIRNGSEVWTPVIERSDVFDEKVLAFEIVRGRANKARVRVEVGRVTKQDWNDMRERFLFISRPKKTVMVETRHGTLIKGDKYKGQIYNKGIFVQNVPEMLFGYDLVDAELDRDRRMVESWNLKFTTRRILMAAANNDKSILAELPSLLTKQSPELDYLQADELSEEAAKVVSDSFVAQYGEDAVPVETLADSADIEHLGKRGIVVPKALGEVLKRTVGDMATVKDNLRKEVAKTYSWHEMTESERENLTSAIALINDVEALKLEDVVVVDFRSDNLMGQFKDGRVLIAHKYLCDRSETLATLVHEVAHQCGGDGDKGHVAQIERIWAGIVNNLRGTR